MLFECHPRASPAGWLKLRQQRCQFICGQEPVSALRCSRPLDQGNRVNHVDAPFTSGMIDHGGQVSQLPDYRSRGHLFQALIPVVGNMACRQAGH
jgi:hypothetical protein